MSPWRSTTPKDADPMATGTPSPTTATQPPPPPSAKPGKKASRVDLPGYTYAELIAMAIQSSPSHMMTITEIHQFLTDNFTCFRTAYSGWRNSIRHNLSARECFYKVPMIDRNRGKRTHYWKINPECSHCSVGDGLLNVAREWRYRRAMAKKGTRKRQRSSKKIGLTTMVTRNADGLVSQMTTDRNSLESNFFTATSPVTPLVYPNGVPWQTHSPSPTTRQMHTTPSSTPVQDSRQFFLNDEINTSVQSTSPACMACADGTTGECEYCVVIDIDDQPRTPSPFPLPASISKCDQVDDGGAMTPESMSPGPLVIDWDPEPAETRGQLEHGNESLESGDGRMEKDGNVVPSSHETTALDDAIEEKDLFQPDDDFDVFLYDLGNHHPHPNSLTEPASSSVSHSSSPSPLPIDLSMESSHTACLATSTTSPSHHHNFWQHKESSCINVTPPMHVAAAAPYNHQHHVQRNHSFHQGYTNYQCYNAGNFYYYNTVQIEQQAVQPTNHFLANNADTQQRDWGTDWLHPSPFYSFGAGGSYCRNINSNTTTPDSRDLSLFRKPITFSSCSGINDDKSTGNLQATSDTFSVLRTATRQHQHASHQRLLPYATNEPSLTLTRPQTHPHRHTPYPHSREINVRHRAAAPGIKEKLAKSFPAVAAAADDSRTVSQLGELLKISMNMTPYIYQ